MLQLPTNRTCHFTMQGPFTAAQNIPKASRNKSHNLKSQECSFCSLTQKLSTLTSHPISPCFIFGPCTYSIKVSKVEYQTGCYRLQCKKCGSLALQRKECSENTRLVKSGEYLFKWLMPEGTSIRKENIAWLLEGSLKGKIMRQSRGEQCHGWFWVQ